MRTKGVHVGDREPRPGTQQSTCSLEELRKRIRDIDPLRDHQETWSGDRAGAGGCKSHGENKQ